MRKLLLIPVTVVCITGFASSLTNHPPVPSGRSHDQVNLYNPSIHIGAEDLQDVHETEASQVAPGFSDRAFVQFIGTNDRPFKVTLLLGNSIPFHAILDNPRPDCVKTSNRYRLYQHLTSAGYPFDGFAPDDIILKKL